MEYLFVKFVRNVFYFFLRIFARAFEILENVFYGTLWCQKMNNSVSITIFTPGKQHALFFATQRRNVYFWIFVVFMFKGVRHFMCKWNFFSANKNHESELNFMGLLQHSSCHNTFKNVRKIETRKESMYSHKILRVRYFHKILDMCRRLKISIILWTNFGDLCRFLWQRSMGAHDLLRGGGGHAHHILISRGGV